MVRNISYTVFFRVLTMLCGAGVVILTTNYLLDEGRGVVSLFLTDVMLVLMINDYIGGSGLVYFTPRKHLGGLLLPSYLWTFLVCLIVPSLLILIGQVPDGLEIHLFLLSFINCVGSINLTIMLGKENLVGNASLIFLKSFVTLGVALLLFMVIQDMRVESFIQSLYFAYGLLTALSFTALSFKSIKFKVSSLLYDFRGLGKIGLYGQTANVLQFLNYRFSFYVIEWWLGYAALGVYSTGIYLADGLLLICRSMATVVYARVANMNNQEEAAKMTFFVSKVSLLITVIVIIPFVLIPAGWYEFVFGENFGGLKWVMIALVPGITGFGLTSIYGNYFGGIGRYDINFIGSLIGFVITLPLSFLFVKVYGILGAGVAASCSYLATSGYLMFRFGRYYPYTIRSFLITGADLALIRKQLKKVTRKV